MTVTFAFGNGPVVTLNFSSDLVAYEPDLENVQILRGGTPLTVDNAYESGGSLRIDVQEDTQEGDTYSIISTAPFDFGPGKEFVGPFAAPLSFP